MEKIEVLSVVKFLHFKGNNAPQIHYEVVAVFGKIIHLITLL